MQTISSYTHPFFSEKRPEGRPNVLLLHADQMRHDTIAAMGYSWMQTPNLDRLVHEGCAFTHGFTNNPVCVPARHSLLTGLGARYTGMPSNNSAVIPPGIPRLPQMLADSGYHCEAVGKMHFRPARTHHGFHRMQLMEELFRNIGDDDYALYLRSVGLGHVRNIHGVRNLLYRQPQRSLLPQEHHGTTWVGRRTAGAIRRSSNRPFFIWSGWIAPHPPFAPPAEFADIYSGAEFPAPHPPMESPHPHMPGGNLELDAPSEAKVRRIRELYYASITHVDSSIGCVLDALEETGQLDNTLIIFTSDHGELLGDCGLWSKSRPHDSSVRVPLLLRWPKAFRPGSLRHDFADNLDLLPTVLDACNIDYPADMDLPGESLLTPQDCSVRRRDEHYMENGRGAGRVVSLRSRQYKYNFWFADGFEELYDLEDDPCETRNLLVSEAGTEPGDVHARMRARLGAYERRYGLTDGSLRPDEEGRRKPWPPGTGPGHNWQFHMHPYNMTEREAAEYTPEWREVMQVTAGEPTVDLTELDLDYYESAGGDPELRRNAEMQKCRDNGLIPKCRDAEMQR